MLKQGEEVVGAPLLGYAKVMGSGSGRAMSPVAAALAFNKRRESPIKPRQLAVIALTADDFLLVNFKNGMVHPVATGVLARFPRAQIAAIELPRAAMMNQLRVEFADGNEWFFDVAKPETRKLRRIIDELASPPA